ncbi:MAG TPA: spore coat U domain-containing protein [Acinetobacter johnsonii]|nr:spore coat U domain-containing protein [Acinetobacter johnsonii]
MKKVIYHATLAVIGLIGIQAANAATTTGTLTVKATVAKGCSVNTDASGTAANAVLDFGTITSLTANVDGDTTGTSIKVLCNNGTAYTVAFGAGNNALSGVRRMAGGSSEFIPYNLYLTSTRATALAVDDTTASIIGNGTPQTLNVYGRIPAGSVLPTAGNYTDAVTLTVTY